MYKSHYVNGDKWFEWMKLEPKRFIMYRIDGDGSHHTVLTTDTLKTVRDTTRMTNHLEATKGGLNKVAHMSDGAEYLTKEDFKQYSSQPELEWGK